MTEIDASAVLWSAPERERAGRPLLVLLHGYGSHEGDLFTLAPLLPLSPVIASVRAPFVEDAGNAWFPLALGLGGTADPQLRLEQVNDTARALLRWLDSLEYTSVGLLGFSQGGAMALQLMRHAPSRFSYAVVLSGFSIEDKQAGDEQLASIKPPVFWGRGTTDQVIPASFIARTADWLPAHSTLTERIYEGVPHAVSSPEIADIGAFIRSQLSA